MPDQKPKTTWQRFIPRIIRHDYVRKLIALFLASIIYIGVLDRLSTNREISPVGVQVIPPAGFVVKDIPSVRLSVSGSQSKLKSLKPEDFSVSELSINPENYKPGEPYILQLTPDNFIAPLGVSVVSVTPETIQIPIDRIETKSLRVKAEYDSSSPLPQGYKIRKTTIKPSTVNVTAPSMILRTLGDVKTFPIKLNTMTQDFDVYQKIVAPHPAVRVYPQEVMVATEIVRTFEEKNFSNLKINIMYSADKTFELPEVKYADVTLSAPSGILQKLTADDINVYVFVDHSAEKGTTRMFQLRCDVAKPGVTILGISPKEIKVTVK